MARAKGDVAKIISQFGADFGKDDLLNKATLSAITLLLDDYGDEIIKRLRDNLERKKKRAGGVLIDTMEAIASEEAGKPTLELLLEDYYKYVNDGRIGKKSKGSIDQSRLINFPPKGPKVPPFEPISKWIRFQSGFSSAKLGKRVRQTSRVGDKLKKARMVDKIRWGIYWNGIEPTYFYTDVINSDLYKAIEEDLIALTGEGLQINLTTFK